MAETFLSIFFSVSLATVEWVGGFHSLIIKTSLASLIFDTKLHASSWVLYSLKFSISCGKSENEKNTHGKWFELNSNEMDSKIAKAEA